MIGSRLKELREQKGLSVEALAEKLKMSPDEILDLESGKSEADALTENKIALALDVPVIDLSTAEDEDTHKVGRMKKGLLWLYAIILLLIYLIGWYLFHNVGTWIGNFLK